MKGFIGRTIVAAVIGAVVFWFYQVQLQGNSITAFIGGQVVKGGGYSLSPALVGWVVHLGVSFSYAFLVGLVTLIPFSRSVSTRRITALVIVLVLGWVTTAIAPPAIQITIAILSFKELPATFWPLNTGGGHGLYNHLLFFVIAWVVHAMGGARGR
ncbi:MAG: hypothetical protein O2807_11155 [bacterium]|nr:hypothetical protein [bacterium]